MNTNSVDVRHFDLRYAITLVLLAVIYVAAAKFGLSLAFATQQVTAVWPPTGLALVALLLFGQRVWPGVLLGAFAINSTLSQSLVTAAGIAAGNTLAPVLGVFLLQRFVKFDAAVTQLRDVFGLLFVGALLAMTVSASNGVANLVWGGVIPWSAYFSVWWVWWMGDVMGVVLFAPFLLSWFAQPRIEWRGWQLVEFSALFTALTVVSYFIFTGGSGYQIQYAVFPFIIWAALRFGQRETASAVLLLCGFAIWGATHDRGPFVTGTLDERLILLEVFMAVAAAAALVLGAVTAQRKRAEESLHRAHSELEIRVQERTADLAAANKELASKNEEVEAFVYIVSHDLRAPLVNLQGFSMELDTSCKELEQALRGANLAPNVAAEVDSIIKDGIGSALRFIRASTTKFQRLIDALLHLSRSGRQEYRSDRVDVQDIVTSTLDTLRQSIDKGATQVHVLGVLPAVIGDATAVGQVFSNLIANALNYLKPGRTGVLEIGSEAQDGMLHFWVKDNGVGIAKAARPRLFQVFQRFRPELAPGEGMGLAIVKRVVERHGGKLWADSE
ncbi:MAG: MASE1 domain-containing protein, partial [Gammaproteobacteria bacterium]|nr:MASE1 domain-containing protein [Gammaproteobacteria bacterium]